MMLKVALFSGNCPSNLGDVWLKRNLLLSLQQKYIKFYYFGSFAPVFSSPDLRLCPINIKSFLLYVVNPFVSCDIFLNPGGGGKRFPGSFHIELTKIILIFFLNCLPNLRVYQLGISAEKSNLMQSLLFFLYSYAKAATALRDKGSIQIAKDRNERNIYFIDDLSFVAYPELLNHTPSKEKSPFCFSLSYACRDKENIVTSFSNVFSSEFSKSFFTFQVDCDYEYNHFLSRTFDCAFKDSLLQSISDFDDSFRQIAQIYLTANIIISDRLHVLLLALNLGIPVIPLCSSSGVNRKINAFFDDLGYCQLPLMSPTPDSCDFRALVDQKTFTANKLALDFSRIRQQKRLDIRDVIASLTQ